MPKIKKDLGYGGAHINTELKLYLDAIVDSMNSIKAQVDDIQSKFNAHTHKENAADAYTKDASTAAIANEQKSTKTSMISIQK
jgi:hypothetical protein